MQIFRHLTINDVQLEEFPFKRELSMEAYLIENEGVLSLDADTFNNVDIVEAELTLKQGRKSKDTDGRIDILATYSQEYIAVIELKLGQLEEIHLKQLEDYLAEKNQILEQYPDILNQEVSPIPNWRAARYCFGFLPRK
jgi:RecB family endonuclease NucS